MIYSLRISNVVGRCQKFNSVKDLGKSTLKLLESPVPSEHVDICLLCVLIVGMSV